MARTTARTAAHGAILAMTLVAGRHASAEKAKGPSPPCDARDVVPAQLRSADCGLLMAVSNGMTRSTTFRELVERVVMLNGIVYLQNGHYVNSRSQQALSGALSTQLTKFGSQRILRLTVALESGDRPIFTLAHEFEHVIEILETDAASQSDVRRLFERIGRPGDAGVMETQAAQDVERIVRRELRNSRD